jgi:hypothetical protein
MSVVMILTSIAWTTKVYASMAILDGIKKINDDNNKFLDVDDNDDGFLV